jgi:hypothetical protein
VSTVTNPAVAAGAAGKTMVKRVVQVTWVASGVSLVFLAYVWGQTLGTAPLHYQDSALQNMANVMAPLIAIALFIERAVEVVISSWRNEGAQHLKATADNATDPVSKVNAQRALEVYRDQTQMLSFITSVTISAVAAMAGVRAIAPLVQDAPTTGVFYAFDIVVTALLLAGGADGLHQIVTTFTDYLDATKSKMNTSPSNATANATTNAATTNTTTTTTTTTDANAGSADAGSMAAG